MPRTALIALIVLAAEPAAADTARDYTFFHDNVMGTSLELCVRADDEAAADRAERDVLAEIDRLARIFSNHDATSEFRRWQAAPRRATPLSPELIAVLGASDRWRDRSGGVFDPRAQGLTRLWSAAAARDRPPTDAEIDAAVAALRDPAWRLDADAGTAERLGDAPLTLDAIAKGFIVERACAAALDPARGVHGLLLNVGGDLRVAGAVARTIGIAPPRAGGESTEPIARVAVKDKAVATSGRYHRGFAIQGVWHSHILDPRTGRPARDVAGATVIADRSADADALATICNVLPAEEGVRLVESVPGAACLIVASDGRTTKSAGWADYERPLPALAVAAPAPRPGDDPAPWGEAFELAVQFEINRPEAEGGRYRRPYVAVWVEDKDGAAVKNLAVWVSLGGSGPFQWLPDLKRWIRTEEVRRKKDKTDMVEMIGQATRQPGKYTLIWNGKDDKGNLVPPGEYTLFLEAVREHGSYQNIRKPLVLGDTPFADDLKGGVEIKSASVEYRRKPASP